MNEIPREREQESQIQRLSDDAEAEEREAVCNCKENETLISTLILKRMEHEATVGMCPRQAAPDFANLAEAGLGMESLHFAATSTHWVVFVRVLPNSENLNMASERLDKVSERERRSARERRRRRRREVPSVQVEDHEDCGPFPIDESIALLVDVPRSTRGAGASTNARTRTWADVNVRPRTLVQQTGR